MTTRVFLGMSREFYFTRQERKWLKAIKDKWSGVDTIRPSILNEQGMHRERDFLSVVASCDKLVVTPRTCKKYKLPSFSRGVACELVFALTTGLPVYFMNVKGEIEHLN